MLTALPAPQHHPLYRDYAKEEDTELTPWSAQSHPFGEGYGQTCTVLRPVQGNKHRVQPLPNGQQQKRAVKPQRERDKRPMHQLRTQHASIDFDSQPMRTTHLALRHHPFEGAYAEGMQTGQEGDSAPRYASGAQAETDKKSMATRKPKGPITVEACGRMAEILAQAPWNEQRARLIVTQIELEKHLNSHNLTCRRLTMMLEELPSVSMHYSIHYLSPRS